MALRVDRISLPRTSPIGPCSVEGLRDFDLVLVTGANGSGKTTLLAPLDLPGSAAGAVSCVDEDGVMRNYSAQGVQREIAFVRSARLLERFQDLSQALGLASKSVRLQHEARLLRQVANQVRNAAKDAIVDEPALVRQRRLAYLAADRACGDQARTVTEYQRLGNRLATRAGIPWGAIDGWTDREGRLERENGLLPRARTVVGLGDLEQSLNSLFRVSGCSGTNNATSRAEAAEARLAESVRAALEALPEDQRPPGPFPEAGSGAQAVLRALRAAASAMNSALEARDLLGQCRSVAARYLRAMHAEGVTDGSCPVCTRSVEPGELGERLAAASEEGDAETVAWRRSKQAFERSIDLIEKAQVERTRSLADATAEHELVRGAMQRCSASLEGSVVQHAASVTAARAAVIHDCREWLAAFADAQPSSAAIEGAGRVISRARSVTEELRRESEGLNHDLADAQRDFNAFQAIGAALGARAEFDATPWHLAMEGIEAAARRTVQRDRWLSALERAAEEREARARDAESTVANDPGVQARFRALMDRMSHPTLRALVYRGRSLSVEQETMESRLSEGQTALVNIAATVAVAGKVAGTPEHKPGWIAFDEPTNGLDETARRQVAAYLGGMTMADLPCQLFVSSFDEEFALQLRNAARAAGRRVRHIHLPPFQAGQPCTPRIEDFRP